MLCWAHSNRALNVVTNGSSLSLDRKSTRLNSSHLVISYAVFCLKKKKKTTLRSVDIHFQVNCLILFEPDLTAGQIIAEYPIVLSVVTTHMLAERDGQTHSLLPD